MYVRVRCFSKPETVVALPSKLTKIEDFRRILLEKFKILPKYQKLVYGGKVLENGFTFYDYGIKLNDVIQLLILPTTQLFKKTDSNQSSNPISSTESNQNLKTEDTQIFPKENVNNKEQVQYKDEVSKIYALGDRVDVKCEETGSWSPGVICQIVQDPDAAKENTVKSSSDRGTLTDKNDNIKINSTQLSNGNSKPSKGITKFFKTTAVDKIKEEPLKNENIETNLLYVAELKNGSKSYCKLDKIRPRSRQILEAKDLKVGMKVLINYCLDNPHETGLWYDFKICEVEKCRTLWKVTGTIYLGAEGVPQHDTVVHLRNKVYAIEKVVPLDERSKEYDALMKEDPDNRASPLNCRKCRDNEKVNCKNCGCYICGGKQDPDKIILCDECDYGFHLACVNPPLTEVPEDDWYCPDCRRDPNEVVAPGAAKQTKKASTTKKDWGRGMACVGKTKSCPMPEDHFGPIPGVEVGMRWFFRMQLSETGVHRPPVSGIHGRQKLGAFSLVLSGGYEDDVDHGDEFTYTGSGGRDLSGNKRTASQSCDQKLARENKALAFNCAVKQITNAGGDAGDNWRAGKPVRVVRSSKMKKHFPKYAPDLGLRYDGIYKVVKFYPEKGQSGFIVWKYLLRRDDPSPAPWDPAAKKYELVYPEGYLEAEAERQAEKAKKRQSESKGKKSKRASKNRRNDASDDDEAGPSKSTAESGKTTLKNKKDSDGNESKDSMNVSESDSRSSFVSDNSSSDKNETDLSDIHLKRKHVLSDKNSAGEDNGNDSLTNASPSSTEPPTKKTRQAVTTADQDEAIKADTLNCKLWADCLEEHGSQGVKEFVDGVAEVFLCIICQDVVAWPVTTSCQHNFCMACLKRAYKVTGQSCPACRASLEKYKPVVNTQLQTALRKIMPGYDAKRKES